MLSTHVGHARENLLARTEVHHLIDLLSWPGSAAISFAIWGALPKLMLRTGLTVQLFRMLETSKKYCLN